MFLSVLRVPTFDVHAYVCVHVYVCTPVCVCVCVCKLNNVSRESHLPSLFLVFFIHHNLKPFLHLFVFPIFTQLLNLCSVSHHLLSVSTPTFTSPRIPTLSPSLAAITQPLPSLLMRKIVAWKCSALSKASARNSAGMVWEGQETWCSQTRLW